MMLFQPSLCGTCESTQPVGITSCCTRMYMLAQVRSCVKGSLIRSACTWDLSERAILGHNTNHCVPASKSDVVVLRTPCVSRSSTSDFRMFFPTARSRIASGRNISTGSIQEGRVGWDQKVQPVRSGWQSLCGHRCSIQSSSPYGTSTMLRQMKLTKARWRTRFGSQHGRRTSRSRRDSSLSRSHRRTTEDIRRGQSPSEWPVRRRTPVPSSGCDTE